jgi:ABC-2 type transport system ATP-binding protein
MAANFGGETFMDLRISNLTKDFDGFKAVNNFSYSLNCGVYGLLGVNGAGKTTLMRMLTTLMKPTSGEILWDGKDVFAMDGKYRMLLGYLPQDFGYYPDFSVYDYLMYIAALKGIRPAVAKQRVKDLLKQVGLVKARNKKMKTLSGGMKRRAGIAQAMLNDPKILILDEPTAGLDPSERIRFRNLISELSEDRIVLLSTHIVSDIEYIANDILLMKDGQLVISGTSEEIIDSMPESVWIAHVSKSSIDACLKRFKVSNVKNIPGGAELRIISRKQPTENAVQVDATLEDVFLYYFGERAGEDDDSV